MLRNTHQLRGACEAQGIEYRREGERERSRLGTLALVTPVQWKQGATQPFPLLATSQYGLRGTPRRREGPGVGLAKHDGQPVMRVVVGVYAHSLEAEADSLMLNFES